MSMGEQSRKAIVYTASLSKGPWRYFCLFICLFTAASVVAVVLVLVLVLAAAVVVVGGWVEERGRVWVSPHFG